MRHVSGEVEEVLSDRESVTAALLSKHEEARVNPVEVDDRRLRCTLSCCSVVVVVRASVLRR